MDFDQTCIKTLLGGGGDFGDPNLIFKVTSTVNTLNISFLIQKRTSPPYILNQTLDSDQCHWS